MTREHEARRGQQGGVRGEREPRQARRCATRRARLASEDGNASVLTIGLVTIVLMLIAFGTALTGIELDRNRLHFIADGAALYASGAFDETSVYEGSEAHVRFAPSETSADERVREYVRQYPGTSARLRNVTVDSVDAYADGRVEVRLSAVTDPPLVGWISRSLDAGVPLRVVSEGHSH